MTPGTLADDFFRREYGRMVAVLARRWGAHRLELVEDSVQWALLQAVRTWAGHPPKNPSAWVYRVAMNRALDGLRTASREVPLLDTAWSEDNLEHEIPDDVLRLLFVACHPEIPSESRLVLALKTLAGFDVREIASHLFTTEGAVYKRLQRARDALRSIGKDAMDLSGPDLSKRLPSVLDVVYAIFNEGYLSHHADASIRNDLCHEALRLATLLAENPGTDTPPTLALLALLHLHSARLSSRNDAAGGLVLLEEQDRDAWDQEQIQYGLRCLAASATGDILSRYHLESAIAAEHCLARSIDVTNWEAVVGYYERLELLIPSPVHRLNRAIAVSRWKGARAALELLAERPEPTWFTTSHPWLAALAMLLQEAGNVETAKAFAARALSAAPNAAIRGLLSRRFSSLALAFDEAG